MYCTRYTSLQANLVECGNLGRYAFIEAESGMGSIKNTSGVISNKVVLENDAWLDLYGVLTLFEGERYFATPGRSSFSEEDAEISAHHDEIRGHAML